MSYKYGWRPDLPDLRDIHFDALRALPIVQKVLPKASALPTGWMPKVNNQGPVGSCVENAIAEAAYTVMAMDGTPSPQMSRLYLYYNVRRGVPEDSGSSIRDGFRALASFGICPESMWPYDTDRWTEMPSADCYVEAFKRRVGTGIRYARLTQLSQMKQCIVDGYGFVFGIAVYQSFEQVGSDGVVPMPRPNERMMGGHAIFACGYDDTRGALRCLNSWGSDWGDGGYFWLPYSYVTSNGLSDDFWTLRSIKE